MAVSGNLDLKHAEARLYEVRARRGISRAGQFPTLNAMADAVKSGSSENSGSGTEHELYNVGFDAGWELDIFGGIRRSVEAAEADLAAGREDLHDVLVTMLAEVALNYIEARTFQARLAVAEANLIAQAEIHQLTQWRYQAGLSDELAIRQARYNLESTRAKIPLLRSGLAEAKNRLAVLLGQAPGGVHALLSDQRPIPVPPVSVAVGVPAETLRQRPDIRKAERELAAQSARIGVATAALYPRFQLTGSIGLQSIIAENLMDAGSSTWRIGPDISWQIFDGGVRRWNIEVQSALQEQKLLQYKAVVLAALEEVENSMSAYAEEQNRRQSLHEAANAAQQAAQLALDKYKAGLVDFDNVLDAQRAQLSFQNQLSLSNGTVTANLVRLYKALGGGWQSISAIPEQSTQEKD
jgi:NodT family efflux transporter outer membrane factor (OMF) lipoprotein